MKKMQIIAHNLFLTKIPRKQSMPEETFGVTLHAKAPLLISLSPRRLSPSSFALTLNALPFDPLSSDFFQQHPLVLAWTPRSLWLLRVPRLVFGKVSCSFRRSSGSFSGCLLLPVFLLGLARPSDCWRLTFSQAKERWSLHFCFFFYCRRKPPVLCHTAIPFLIWAPKKRGRERGPVEES